MTASLLIFLAVLSVTALVLGLRWSAVVFAGLAVLAALLASSLAVTHLGAFAQDGPGLYAVRFLPPLVVLCLANVQGRWRVAVMQVAWMWCLLDLIFVLRNGTPPSLSQFLTGYMPLYPLLPGAAWVLMVGLPRASR